MPKWLKTTLKVAGALIALLLIILLSVTLYVVTHKNRVLALVTTTLNKNIDGTLTIGSMNPTFFKGFPDVSLTLNNVSLKDKKWDQHHHTLLSAKELAVSVNMAALIKGIVQVNKIDIEDAAIDLYTDSAGYSNTAVFGKKKPNKKETKEESESSTEIKHFSLNNVSFTLANQKANKLFQFAVDNLQGNVDYPASGWHANLDLKALAKSLSFNTKRGSFIKNKELEGPFDITYDEKAKIIVVAPNKLKIGDDPFTIGAKFNLADPTTPFNINIAVDNILWRNASALLAPNITTKLNMFNLKNPLSVKCLLKGSFSGSSDPLIFVTCHVQNNELSALGGVFTECSFDGVFTNNYINGMGLTDANSAIKIFNLNAKYKDIPITIDTGIVNNLDNPVAQGTVHSKFDVQKINNVLGTQTLQFSKGDASLKLAVKANIVNFKLYKPAISGLINVDHANLSYVPRSLNFTNTSVGINFSGNDLLLNNIRLQTGRSIVLMQGRINNFLNLYYDAPEHILIKWQIRSPQLYLAEFLSYLSTRHNAVPEKHTSRTSSNSSSGSFIDQFNYVFEKANADMHMSVANLHYKKFLATDVNADILVSAEGILLKKLYSKQAGGSLAITAHVMQGATTNNRFTLNSTVKNVNVRSFFYAFNNFGLTGLTYENLKGYLSANADITGIVTNEGSILPGSVNGAVNINLRKGALVNFGPLKSIDKYFFFRNLSDITFDNLNGKFDLHGQKITIEPMMISSSVLNMNVAGDYAMNGKGTNIALDVPLRNPEKDKNITNKKEKEERRMKGIVLHLLATDGDNGSIKIKLNKNHDKKTDDSK